jgi:uncharacterized protein YrrD
MSYMLRRIDTLWGTPVASLQTGASVAYLDLPVINPKNLKVVAFYLSGGLYHGMLLDAKDIREVGNNVVVINHEDLIGDESEFIKIAPLLEKPYEMFNKLVYNQDDKKIGKIKSYTVSDDDFRIMRLDVAPRLTGAFLDIAKVVSRESIIEVAKNYIKVNDDGSVRVNKPSRVLSPAVGAA